MILIHVLSWRRRPSRLPRAVSVEAGSRRTTGQPNAARTKSKSGIVCQAGGSGRHFREIERVRLSSNYTAPLTLALAFLTSSKTDLALTTGLQQPLQAASVFHGPRPCQTSELSTSW